LAGDQAPGVWSFPVFRRVFIAKAVSSVGSYMQLVAATWYAYQLTGSAASVGVLSALALGPSVLGGPSAARSSTGSTRGGSRRCCA
jgi:hypothetical protein